MCADVLRVMTIGDSFAGKSSIIHYFNKGQFFANINETIGVDFLSKNVNREGKEYKLQIYDTSGQERFRTISANYYKRADGVILVFDLTTKQSYDNMSFWLDQMREQIDINNIGIVLVGNKVDLTDKRTVSTEQGNQLAKTLNINYFETSALTGVNIEECFNGVIDAIIQKKQVANTTEEDEPKGKKKEKINLGSDNKGANEKKKCC